MPIKYTYLEDSSPFTADALNVRVSDATDGINELKQDDIGHGAFRTEHLPTMIGVPGIDDPADQLFAVSNHIKFNPTVHRSPYSSTFEIAGAVLNYTDTTGRPEVVPGGETTALLILFNLQVRRFLGKDLKAFHATANNYEDLVSATFWFKIKVINPNVGGTDPEISFGIPHSARTISPGLTQVEITDYDASVAVSYRYNLGQAYEWDDLSHKNVAIIKSIESLSQDNVGIVRMGGTYLLSSIQNQTLQLFQLKQR